MSESIIKELKIKSAYTPREPYADLPPSALREFREKINDLNYNDFLLVLSYVRKSRLPPDFKEELEMEYGSRGRGKP